MNRKEQFNIRQMIELTGISEFTIRGWENRYKAFTPDRTETGRRAYKRTDIQRALLLRELIKRGNKIGNIAKLNNSKLQSLFRETHTAVSHKTGNKQIKYACKAIELVTLQKWPELNVLFKKVPLKNISRLIHDFFLPALHSLTSEIEKGFVTIAQEHVFSSFIKEKIYTALSQLEAKNSLKNSRKKIRFVLASSEGDFHEIGLLMAHLLIRSYEFTSLYLGPNTPYQDLSETALRFNSSHVLITSTISRKSGARQEILTFANEIQKKTGSNTQIILAGGQAPALTNDSKSSLIYIDTFQTLENHLQKLAGTK